MASSSKVENKKLSESKQQRIVEQQKEHELMTKTGAVPKMHNELKMNSESDMQNESKKSNTSELQNKTKIGGVPKMHNELKINSESDMQNESKKSNTSELQNKTKIDGLPKMHNELKMNHDLKMQNKLHLEGESALQYELKINSDSDMQSESKKNSSSEWQNKTKIGGVPKMYKELKMNSESDMQNESKKSNTSELQNKTKIGGVPKMHNELKMNSESDMQNKSKKSNTSELQNKTKIGGVSKVHNESKKNYSSELQNKTKIDGMHDELKMISESYCNRDLKKQNKLNMDGKSALQGELKMNSESNLYSESNVENKLNVNSERNMHNELQVDSESKVANESLNNNEQVQEYVSEKRHSLEGVATERASQLQLVKSPSTARINVAQVKLVMADMMSTVSYLNNAPSPDCQALALALTTGNADPQKDVQARLRTAKFVSLLLAKMWQSRRGEVMELQEQVRRYQQQVKRSQQDVLMHNQLICVEQRRREHLSARLADAMDRISSNAQNVEQIEEELHQMKQQEMELRNELEAKRNECETYEELLHETKADFFRELHKFRQTALALTDTQRQIHRLQVVNAELEDKLLSIQNTLQMQSDRMTITLANNQLSLGVAYETLKRFEEHVTELLIQHQYLVHNRVNAEELKREIARLRDELGLLRYLICFCGPQRWRQLRARCASQFNYFYNIAANIVENHINPCIPKPLRNSVYLTAVLSFLVIGIRVCSLVIKSKPSIAIN